VNGGSFADSVLPILEAGLAISWTDMVAAGQPVAGARPGGFQPTASQRVEPVHAFAGRGLAVADAGYRSR